MLQFIFIANITLICSWGRVCCVMCFCILVDSIQSSEMHYKMQHKYFLTGFRKWPNTASWGSVRISFMDISLRFWLGICHLEGNFYFWISQKVFGDLFQRSHSFVNPNHLKTWLPNHWCPFPFHSQGWMPCKQQSNIPTVFFLACIGVFLCTYALYPLV